VTNGTVKVRRAVGDEAILRELRPQAPSDVPDALGSSDERELARTLEDCRRWLSPGATFIPRRGHTTRGLVACVGDATASTLMRHTEIQHDMIAGH
jgi:hypothetical protein